MADIKLIIRQSSGEQFEVDVAAGASVLDLKKACEKGSSLPPEQQRLIFKGKLKYPPIIAIVLKVVS
jgi:hypothetical protein